MHTQATKVQDRSQLASSYIVSKRLIRIPFVRKTIDDKTDDPINKFRKLALIIIQLNQAVSSIKKKDTNDRPYRDYRVKNSDGVVFDLNHYKRSTGYRLSDEALKTFKYVEPKDRTEEQITSIVDSIIEGVPEYLDFPDKIRRKIAQVASYQEFETGRVIIRQNHKADNFYFMISGITAVQRGEINPETHELENKTIAYLSRGKSFGELAIMNAAPRNASILCHSDVVVLSIGRDDFIDLFMQSEGSKEPEFVSYLRDIDIFTKWNQIESLPYNDPNICLITFFRKGVIMCKDSSKSEWIYCVKVGTCRVIKKIRAHEKRSFNKYDPFFAANYKIQKKNSVFKSLTDNYLEVTKLKPRDVFGLNELLFEAADNSFSSTLISEGAECILINKEFFMKHLTEIAKNQLKRTVVPYPNDLSLEQKIQTNADWEKFKKDNFRRLLNKRQQTSNSVKKVYPFKNSVIK